MNKFLHFICNNVCNLSTDRQIKTQNFSSIKILLISVFVLSSIEMNAQCVTPPTSGNITFASNTLTCFTTDATLSDVTFQDGSEIYIEPGVTVIIQNNVSSSGTITMDLEGTLQFNQSPQISANVDITIASSGELKAGSSGTNDFTFQGNGINTIVNYGLVSAGVLNFNGTNGEYTTDNHGTMNITANVNISGTCYFKNSGILDLGNSYNCNDKTVFVNCGIMTSGNGFNLNGGQVYNSSEFIVSGGNISFGNNTAYFENTGHVDIQSGQLLLAGNGSEYYNEGFTEISNNIQNDGNITGPPDGSGKLGYMTWFKKAAMNSGTIGPNLNLKRTNGASSQVTMFNNQGLNFSSSLTYDCEASGNCIAPKVTAGDICWNPDGSISLVIVATDDDYSTSPIAPGDSIASSVTQNDTLNDEAVVLGTNSGEVSITDVTGDTSVLTLDPITGGVSISSDATPGTYTLTYTLCENEVSPANCDTAVVTVLVENETPTLICTETVTGEAFNWSYGGSQSQISQTMTQPGVNGGFEFDIYELDNSFNMEINGVSLATHEIEFQSSGTSGINIEFEDGDEYETDTQMIWQMDGTTDNPLIRVLISPSGEVSMYGSKTSGGQLFPLQFKQDFSPVNSFNTISWNPTSNNTIIVTQNVQGPTLMDGYGSGLNIVPCDSYTLEKEGEFNDENNNGIAEPGETITYTITVKNKEDIDIYDIIVEDPLLGGVLTGPQAGDTNNDGVFNIYETWTYTESYTITQADIDNKGVYNLASVTGTNELDEDLDAVSSIDPNPLDPSDPNYDPARPDHTFVPLKSRSLLITNPNIYQRVKSN
ncbi:G8 domain-containing protein [Winogradskyella sp. SM1960]|uniref:DUF7507 domain-containing protein n=1 Tax=Winogradskyella sp. SM1960 TaxID=2865955 RepID=UPI001CD3CC02|nr:hypothetical protein [Winogradskyella sp. SM1960]